MAQQTRYFAALIGDMIGSQRSPDRGQLQEKMSDVFEQVELITGVRPEFTIGDEFQARYMSLVEATIASLHLHLHSWHLTRLRVGIGWGELVTEGEARSPYGEDGPCWWRAREAVETLQQGGRGRAPSRRTLVHTESSLDELLNGYLLLRDTVMDGFDEIDARLAIGLLDGRSQTELAGELRMNKSSVSRRANSHGVLAVIEAAAMGTPPLPSQP